MDRSLAVLRPGGTLAIVETHWGVGAEVTRFSRESQDRYARWDSSSDPHVELPTATELPRERSNLHGSTLTLIAPRAPEPLPTHATEFADGVRTTTPVDPAQLPHVPGERAATRRLTPPWVEIDADVWARLVPRSRARPHRAPLPGRRRRSVVK